MNIKKNSEHVVDSELVYAKKILSQEIFGLESLRDNLDDSLIAAIDLMYSKKGHVIVSGMGKPGHIGRKIAATMSSTGTPSFFLHPAEASHGDLGVISANDLLLVLSLSGNTQELLPMLAYANRFGIDIVAITADAESMLAKAASVTISIPKVKEACPYNLAPTTSTTMMIAIGDVFALCLLKRREFMRENFKNLHPGGALGKQLLMVKDLMHTNMPIVFECELMKDVLVEITSKAFGCAGVVNEQREIVGIITDGDLRRNIGDGFLDMKAVDVMTSNPQVASVDMFAQEATRIMNQKKITNIFIVENGRPIGIIHLHDCLRAGLA